MSHGPNNAWIQRLSRELGLTPWSQDWGIMNADPTRVGEFIRFFESHEPHHPWEPEALAELILESANDALLAGSLSAEASAQLVLFLRAHAVKFPSTVGYWSKLDVNEWPVARVLQKARAG